MDCSNICRLCLSATPVAFSLLSNDTNKMLEALTSMKLTPTDEALMICLKCSLNLKLAYSIQQNIIRSVERLAKYLLRDIKIKNEVVLKSIYDDMADLDYTSVELCDSTCIICGVEIEDSSLGSHIKQHFTQPQLCDCGQHCPDIQSYRTHTLQHGENMTHQCKQCDIIFKYKSLYNMHIEKVHPKVAVEVPNITKHAKRPQKDPSEELDELQKKGIGTNLAQKLTALFQEKTIKEEKAPRHDALSPYTCDICLKKFTDKRRFRNHNHRRKTCPMCKKEVTADNFSKHVTNHTSGPQVCEQCGKTFMNLESLRGHIFYKHRGKHYECEKCKIPFNSRQALNGHRKREHTGTEHVCETCGRKFFFSYDLKKHIKITHMKMRPYVCEFCKKGFSGLHAMKTHRRQHTNETPYRCEVCGEGFRQNVSLKAHRKSKHNIVETLTSSCEICGKGFSSMHAVKAHMRCH